MVRVCAGSPRSQEGFGVIYCPWKSFGRRVNNSLVALVPCWILVVYVINILVLFDILCCTSLCLVTLSSGLALFLDTPGFPACLWCDRQVQPKQVVHVGPNHRGFLRNRNLEGGGSPLSLPA
ncbi:hypothetical protein ATANTOWER_000656, partial [Ataeniobius toweri]|nr:hypothetical protein [Ataeniobius toweri]